MAREMDKNEREFLKNYDSEKFKHPSITNDLLIFTTDNIPEENKRKVPKKGLQILLVKRNEYPFKDKWAIPGGFVDINETLEEAAERKLLEETGIKNMYMEQLYTFGSLDRDPRTRVISVANVALISKENISYADSSKQLESKWFWVRKEPVKIPKKGKKPDYNYILTLESEDEEIEIIYHIYENIKTKINEKKEVTYKLAEDSDDELAFDHHEMIDCAIDRIRNKVEYTPIALNLLPRLFTVKELQFVYEAIMGREILNFRRKMGDMIIETDEVIHGKPFRPAKVFKFNEDFKHEF